MKSKPGSHKSQNTFKFQTFSERIAGINIDVIHRIAQTSDVPEEGETFFYDALKKWTELNCTAEFDEFKTELGSDVTTLPQLVLRQEEVIKCLQRHLQIPGSLALQPLLQLVVAAARDLQFDFYPYYPQFFKITLKILNAKDAEILEWCFTCLSYLFKFLWRYMVKDIEKIFQLYAPLFGTHNPTHIRDFAAESFAFLMRKVPDKNMAFKFVFLHLGQAPEQSSGVGQLLFEIMKGVKKQFHSCSSQLLPLLFGLLGSALDNPQGLPWEQVLEAELQMAKAMTIYAERRHMSPLWDSLLACIQSLCQKVSLHDDVSRVAAIEHLGRILKIAELFATFEDCALVQKPDTIVEVLIILLKQKKLSDDDGTVLLRMSSCILLNRSSNLQMAQITNLVLAVFNSDISYNKVFGFVQEMFSYGMFEKDILSYVLIYCERILVDHPNESNEVVMGLLAQLVLHFRPLPPDLSRWKTFNWDLHNLHKKQDSAILKLIETSFEVELNASNLPMIWAACVLTPHIRGLRKQKIVSLLHGWESKCSKYLEAEEVVSDKVLFLLYYIILTLLHLESRDEFFKTITEEWMTTYLSRYSSNIFLLKLIDVIISHTSGVRMDRLKSCHVLASLFDILKNNLSSPYHAIRISSLRILATLQPAVRKSGNKSGAEDSVFTICLAAENAKADVHNYREKLKHLQKLDYGLVHCHLPVGKYEQVALRYLLGTLYVNFQLLWEPILGLIESHAEGLKASDFWDVYLDRLHEVVNLIGVLHFDDSKKKNVKNEESYSDGLQLNVLQSLFQEESHPLTERADHVNHRILLWRGLQKFPGIVEAKNRVISTLVLEYLEKEYYRNDVLSAPSQDIMRKNLSYSIVESEDENLANVESENDDSGVENNDDDNASDEEIDASERKIYSESDKDKSDEEKMQTKAGDVNISITEKEESRMAVDDTENYALKRRRTTNSARKSFPKPLSTVKTLCAHLAVIAKFRNPKAAFREPELKELMHKFLSHRIPEVQKYALDFLMAYNDRALVPYKDNFYNLLNDKTFKTEITSFNIDVQSKVIQEEHRKMVLPVLIGILYGKMQNKTGRNTSGKGNSNLRRSIVLRFLAGSQEAELTVFLNLAFQSYDKLVDGDVLEVVKRIKSNINATQVIPLKQLQASLNLLAIIFSKLGNLVTDHLPRLLKLLLCIVTMLAQLLEIRNSIQPQYINPIKDLRISAILHLAHFFQLFDSYPFTTEEIDAIFECAVWPQVSRLHFESLYSPTALMKLFFKWSCNSRYFILLTKQKADDSTIDPLTQIMELFIAPKTRPTVVNLIIDMLENLLTLADEESMDVDEDEQSEKGPPLLVNGAVKPVQEDLSHKDAANYGTLLLLRHIPNILDRLKKIVSKVVKSSRRLLPDKLLTILTRISEYVTDPDLATEMGNLLLPFLAKKSSYPESMEIGILKTVDNLMKYTAKPESFIKTISKLFAHLKHRNTRTALCDILSAIANRKESVLEAAVIVAKINAWDARWMEEPDYPTRLDGYRSAVKFLGAMKSVDMDFILLITFNCCYFVSETSDLSLRESAAHFLQQLIKCLSTFNETDKDSCLYVLYTILFPEVKKGLRSKNEATRHEFLVVLGTIVDTFPTLPKLSDLHLLKDVDAEVDFFENIRHIQIHRRARALTRVARSDHIKIFHEDTLLQYLMPIATSFLFNDVYAKHPNLIDAAVELLAGICLHLSWYQYENTLRHYLNILPKSNEYPKLAVKVVVAILDAFHFDLTRSEGLQESSDSKEARLVLIEEVTAKEVVTATKIHKSIAKGILPQLHRCLTRKTRSEGEHKSTRHEYPEDEEILRVPIALAMVKLLQHLPKGSLEQSLPGLFLKLCTLLKSRADSIREMTRDTVIKIMESLGPKFFPYLLKQMRQTMTKGYQVHVMIFTIHSVLHRLSEKLTVGDLDSCLPSLLQICHEELFGQVGEEKEVAQITGKLKEARGNKSYSIYEIIAKYVSEDHLVGLVKPIRDVLSSTYKHQAVRKAQECLQNTVLGLSENNALSTKCLLIFVYGLVSESIPELNQERKKKEIKTTPMHLVRTDSYLLSNEPARGGGTSKTSCKTNAHILIEFGLQLLYFSLKRDKISSRDETHLQMLDPFIPILTECLTSPYVKLTSSSLRCLNWLLKFPLPSLRRHIHRLSSSLFVLLNKFGTTGAGQGENFEMVVMAFKVVTVLVRDIDYHTITSDQLRVLLTYAEQDIVDHTRQATAFGLLRAILSRKLVADEIDDVMKKVGEMCVSSDVEHIRVQCRQVFLQFLIDYPLGKKLKQHLEFFTAQLCFDHEYGRLSALEMLSNILTTFPQPTLKKYSGLFFVSLSTCLVNDDSTICRKFASQTIKTLLQKIESSDRNVLFGAVVAWLKDNKMRHRRLAAQLCGIFVDADGEGFLQHVHTILPIFIQQLLPDKYADIHHESVERTADHIIFYILNSFLKIVIATDLFKKPEHRLELNQLLEYVQYHLLHGHAWVRLAACQLFGLLFSHYSASELGEAAFKEENKDEYLLTETRKKIQTLCYDFLSQFRSPTIEPDLADQVIKNLVYIAKVIWNLQMKKSERNSRTDKDDESEADANTTESSMTIDWLIKRMNREPKFEVANNPKVTVKRSSVFKWLAAVASDLGCEGLSPRLPFFLKTLQRELSDNSSQADKDLKTLASEVVDLIRKMVGTELFARHYTALQSELTKKRSDRRVQKAQEAVSNPEIAAKRRIKKQVSKKVSQKRKLERLRPTKSSKKRKLKDMAIVS